MRLYTLSKKSHYGKNMDELATLKNKKVLFVEDDEVIRESIAKTLQIFFDTIVTAKDGKEAMELLDMGFDIAILDYNLPFFNGIDIAREIRTKSDETIIFMISNYQETRLLRDAMGIGAIDYLEKPLSFAELKNTLLECAKRLSKKEEQIICEGLCYNKRIKSIFKNNEEIKLTKNEIVFLELILENSKKLIHYDLITEELFKSQNTEANLPSIKNMILRLRKKLGIPLVESVSGVGYRVL